MVPAGLKGHEQHSRILSQPECVEVGLEEDKEIGCGGGEGADGEKRRRKKGRKKRQDQEVSVVAEMVGLEKELLEALRASAAAGAGKQQQQQGTVDCLYPFSSFSSTTQRRIKQRYDELVKSNEAKALTVAQVGDFINCLVEARNDLQHKSQIVKRKFTITKALLLKAERPSFDRLCQQICKLEAEHKRLEEDAVVYNRIQQQLKLSPAFQTMLEIGARAEAEAANAEKSLNSIDSDPEYVDISFEELLAQEKKDSFWQKNGKLRSCSR